MGLWQVLYRLTAVVLWVKYVNCNIASTLIYRYVFRTSNFKCIDNNDERVFYKDGEFCDIPEHCRLDILVQMPEYSVWDLKQKSYRMK